MKLVTSAVGILEVVEINMQNNKVPKRPGIEGPEGLTAKVRSLVV
jgi:hypothetical protein